MIALSAPGIVGCACGAPGGGSDGAVDPRDAAPLLDARIDLDSSVADADSARDAPADSPEFLGSDADVGLDASGEADAFIEADAAFDCTSCSPPGACESLGCDGSCRYSPLADGATCGEGSICIAGACRSRGCGDGYRETGELREACDDGNTDPGDACGPDCTPTVLEVPGVPSEDALATPAHACVGAAGDGALLFVWSVREAPVGGETFWGVWAQRRTAAGVAIDPVPIVLATGIWSGPPNPTVAGLRAGWAVAWREHGDLGDVVGAFLSRDGSTRALAPATDSMYEQREPALAALGDGFVVAWATNGSSAATNGIRARVFESDGRPRGSIIVVTTEMNAAAPRLAAGSGARDWTISWTGRDPTTTTRADFRRYADNTAVDAAPLPLSGPEGAFTSALARFATGWRAAWIGRAGADYNRLLAADVTDAAVLGAPERFGLVAPGSLVSAADLGPGAAIAHQVASVSATLVSTSGVTARPPEWDAAAALLAAGATDVGLSPTREAIWITWTSTDTTSRMRAYRMPRD